MRHSTVAEPAPRDSAYADARDPRPGHVRLGFAALALAVLLGAWVWASRDLPAIVLPTPARTGDALLELARSGELVAQLGRTLGRTALGSALGIGLGITLGVAAGLSMMVDGLLQPLRVLLAGLPRWSPWSSR